MLKTFKTVLDNKAGLLALLALGLFLIPRTASAHVKWFSEFSFADQPTTLPNVIDPLFFGLMALSMAGIAVAVILDRQLESTPWYNRVADWLEERADNSILVMRIATGATLLMSWQADALLVPELTITAAWVGWLQFIIALLLLFRDTTPIAGAGLLLLYGIGVMEYGLFYMLDYVLFFGVAWFLMVSNFKDQSIYGTGIPALYLTVGFSLIWVGIEKLIYPQWSFYILEQNPQLALGLPLEFFLTSAAFVELALGFLLVIGLLGRPLSLVVTLVFFTTTLVFGKVEVIGHTIIHGALIVFLLEGPGPVYKAPYQFLKKLVPRTAFASFSFAATILVLAAIYALTAQQVWQNTVAESGYQHEAIHMMATTEVEGAHLAAHLTQHDDTYSLHVEHSGPGHPVLVINGWRVGTLDETVNELGAFQPGVYDVKVILVEGDTQLASAGEAIAVTKRVIVSQ